ncbi:hypothetical protein MTR67_018797 [Solanum verrucosum]|uniref:DUF4218 domain-containing protein n=1 Tax=Solanum verrucosum TaxID=315347 RepID=A0AAF0QMF6_SOLVR|nr:hypothetical protein MTR67_018797 [Solanum verrucosum]
MSTSYSMWPVILTPYNLPPWKCFKDPFMMMSLLILGPQAPGKDIDVYLRPLIDELKELWSDGVETFDAPTGKCFKMHVAVLWTINDFPAYGNLSGWSTKGYMACPTCNKDTSSEDDVLKQLDLLSTYRAGKRSNNKKKKRLPEELNWVRRRCVSVDDDKITKLKRHDYHVLLQRVLSIALRGFVNKDVSLALIELGHFFQRLCLDMLSQLYRDDVDSVILDANVIELEAQKEHEVHYNKENSDQEDETMIEYISDHEENGGNNGTNDNKADTASDGDDIGL